MPKKPEKEGAIAASAILVRRVHRRDLNRVWDFLKLVFRDVNRETVEYQRPRSKKRFLETYDEEGVEQFLFTAGDDIVGYSECTVEVSGSDNWYNQAYFEKRGMRPIFVEELAVHPEWQGRGVGQFMLDQIEHVARLHGCTHVVLEVAENNESALAWYRKRHFFKLDAAIFLAQKIPQAPDLLPPRRLKPKKHAVIDAPRPSSRPKARDDAEATKTRGKARPSDALKARAKEPEKVRAKEPEKVRVKEPEKVRAKEPEKTPS